MSFHTSGAQVKRQSSFGVGVSELHSPTRSVMKESVDESERHCVTEGMVSLCEAVCSGMNASSYSSVDSPRLCVIVPANVIPKNFCCCSARECVVMWSANRAQDDRLGTDGDSLRGCWHRCRISGPF